MMKFSTEIAMGQARPELHASQSDGRAAAGLHELRVSEANRQLSFIA
jgi:hypothetical protein